MIENEPETNLKRKWLRLLVNLKENFNISSYLHKYSEQQLLSLNLGPRSMWL